MLLLLLLLLLLVVVNDFVMKHAFNVDLYPFLDVIGNIFVKRCAEFDYNYVIYPSFVYN